MNLNCLPPRPDSERADSEMTYHRDIWLCSMLQWSVLSLACLTCQIGRTDTSKYRHLKAVVLT